MADPRHVGATDRPLIGAWGKVTEWRPFEPKLFKNFRPYTGLTDILRARTQITDNFRSKSFACGKREFISTIFVTIPETSYRPGQLPGLARPLGRPGCISKYSWRVMPVCYPVTVISLMNSELGSN
jgi:hypothetical protein